MAYESRKKKISTFAVDDALTDASTLDFIKNGINKKTSWANIRNKLAEVFGLSARIFSTEADLIASDISIGEYAIVEENNTALYKITSLAANSYDVTLTSGFTASLDGPLLLEPVADYTALRAINTKGIKTGQTLSVTNSGIGGTGVLRNVVAHGLTDNGGTIIVISADWYWVRDYNELWLASWFGALIDGVTDDSTAFNNALTYAAPLGIPVVWRGRAAVNSQLILRTGNTLEGLIASPWEEIEGSELISGVTGGLDTVLLSERGTAARNFKIRGTLSCNGVGTATDTYRHDLTRIVVSTCAIGFNFRRSWSMDLNYLRTEICTTGYKTTDGQTSCEWVGCLAYSGTLGFDLDGLTYNNFSGCGTDLCAASLLVKSCRGVTFSSYGVEGASTYGIRVESTNAEVTFTSPLIGDHTGKTINIWEFVAGATTIVGVRMPSVFNVSAPGKFFDYTAGSVTLINPNVFGEVGDIDNMTVIGGINTNRFQEDLTLQKAKTLEGTTASLTASGGQSAVLFTMTAGAVYLCTAVNNVGGTQRAMYILSSDGSLTTNTALDLGSSVCQFIFSGNDVLIQNDSGSAQAYQYSVVRLS